MLTIGTVVGENLVSLGKTVFNPHLPAESVEPLSTNNNIFSNIEVVFVSQLKVYQSQSKGAVSHHN